MSHFQGTSVFERIREAQRAALHAANVLGEKDLVRPEDDIVDDLRERFGLEAPRLRRDELEIIEAGEAGPGQLRAIFAVPFDGQPGLFDVQPSSILVRQFRGVVRGSELLINVSVDGKSGEDVEAELDRELDHYETALAQLRSHLSGYNANLRAQLLSVVRPRREKALEGRSVLTSLKFPVRRNPEASLPVPVKKKLPVTPKPGTTTPTSAEWEIPLSDYNTILDSTRSMGQVMERSPGTFSNLSEEGIRDFFLVVLNFGYEGGAAMSEVFNGAGKTDILIPVKDRNVFIAECKVWHGADKFKREAVDALLGNYLSWRDTKCAILLFIYERGVSGIFDKACEVIRASENFVRDAPGAVGPLERRFVLHWPGDPDRPLLLTLQAFAVPLTSAPRTSRKAAN